MIERLFFQIYDIWRYGGVVMPSLIATAFVLWYALGLRILVLRRGDRRPLRTLLADCVRNPDIAGSRQGRFAEEHPQVAEQVRVDA